MPSMLLSIPSGCAVLLKHQRRSDCRTRKHAGTPVSLVFGNSPYQCAYPLESIGNNARAFSQAHLMLSGWVAMQATAAVHRYFNLHICSGNHPVCTEKTPIRVAQHGSPVIVDRVGKGAFRVR